MARPARSICSTCSTRLTRVTPLLAGGRSLSMVGVVAPLVLLGVLTLVSSVGCSSKPKRMLTAPPPLTFAGPKHLHGSVGSFVRLRRNNPLLVSGYGLVVNLPGTGSGDVPREMRKKLVQEYRAKGLGNSQLGTEHLSPERVLDSNNTALVVVQGVIPPGAVKGSRFDVLVSAHPATETTSLQGGRLWTTQLGVLGANVTMSFTRTRGIAGGPIYVDPLNGDAVHPSPENASINRTGVILSGGVVSETRYLQLILNQPSWTRSGQIADRINERFRRGPRDGDDTAIAKNDSIIELRIPYRYSDNADHFVGLVNRLFLQGTRTALIARCQEMLELLQKDPKYAQDAKLVWEAAGRHSFTVLHKAYTHAEDGVRLAALEAGSRLGDGKAVNHLLALASDKQTRRRAFAAKALRYHPDSLRGARMLSALLSDDDRDVRIAAYHSLSDMGDPIVTRMPVGVHEEFKFMLDLVPSDKPMIYVSQSGVPTITVFSHNTGFKLPMLGRLWENRLMLRGSKKGEPLTVFFQDHGRGRTYTQPIAPTVANLAFLLGHKPTQLNDTPGFDLSFSQVVNALHELHKSGQVHAGFHIVKNGLANQIARADAQNTALSGRPDTDGDTGNGTGALSPAGNPDGSSDGRLVNLPGRGDAPKPNRPEGRPDTSPDPDRNPRDGEKPSTPDSDDKDATLPDAPKPPAGGGLLPAFPTERE